MTVKVILDIDLNMNLKKNGLTYIFVRNDVWCFLQEIARSFLVFLQLGNEGTGFDIPENVKRETFPEMAVTGLERRLPLRCEIYYY